MDNLLSVHLEAHHDAANRHRVYVVILGRDLFGRWSLRVRYGRAGQRLRELQFSGDEEEIRAELLEHLRRRLSAPRRIGCAYRLCSLDFGAREFDRSWLPADLIQRFLVAPASPAAAAA